MATYRIDRRWSDQFIPSITKILSQYLICVSEEEDDWKRVTDLIVLDLKPKRIACRVRKASYRKLFGHEFTIRGRRPSGAKTELQKILQRWGDWYFYAFAEKDIVYWSIYDLNVFRRWYEKQLKRGNATPYKLLKNDDGSSEFYVFNSEELPEDLIIGRGDGQCR